MSTLDKFIDTVMRLKALETRTEDVVKSLDRVENKIDNLLERISKLEVKYESLKNNIKSEILGDIKSEIVLIQERINNNKVDNNSLPK